MLDRLRDKVRGYVPFTNWWYVWQKLDKDAESILDLGCGNGGKPMQFINRNKQFYTVGVDGYAPYIERCHRESSHNEIILSDIRDIPYDDSSFDVVLLLGILEHFNKSEGIQLLKRAEGIARKQVLILTDIGEYEHEVLDGNVLQVHKYIWSAEELKEFGFKVWGLGIPHWYGRTGVERYFPRTLRGFVELPLRVLSWWFVYSHPQYGGKVICVKEIE